MTDRKEIWMAESIAFFEGRYMPLKEAKISIADPAVTKSDIVFDVVSVTSSWTSEIWSSESAHPRSTPSSCIPAIDVPADGDDATGVPGAATARSHLR